MGAAIDLGLCLNLTSLAGIRQVQEAYDHLVQLSQKTGMELPENSPDQLRRHLDCRVIEALHEHREDEAEAPIDTIRGVFVEGEPLFPNSGIYGKTHIQIAVRNPDCIQSVFRVRVQPRFLR